MNFKEFKQAGHWPTLLSAFLYFDVSFMVWVMLGPLSLYITKDLALPLEEKFTIVAIPILSGAVFRIILGSMADHIGPKLTGVLAQLLVILGLAYVFVFGLHSKPEVEILGLLFQQSCHGWDTLDLKFAVSRSESAVHTIEHPMIFPPFGLVCINSFGEIVVVVPSDLRYALKSLAGPFKLLGNC